MRQTLSKGMVVAAAAATGVLSLYGSPALADSHAHGAAKGSPGVLSGNSLQVPVHVPVNVCGNSVDAVAALNPAFGNACANDHGSQGRHGLLPRHARGDSDDDSGHDLGGHGDQPSAGSETTAPPYGDEETTAPPYGDEETTAPPYGDEETTAPPYGDDESTPPPYGGDESTPPGGRHSTPPSSGHSTPPSRVETTPPSLPHTGGDARAMFATSAASAALIAAGAVLYRRGRATSRR
ncbi:chaplin family protein [Streptomyces sp. NPDC052109]|uniref:chaplin n=1 Tax=Streptomyces sp. NPDC052109 TaxID=3155527 RepID=UPI00344A6EDC